jgi:transcriptional regulator with XRE-family HTH domain
MIKEDLKQWRKEKGMSQAKLAELLGVRVMTVSRWELGTRSIPTLLSLALIGLETKLHQEGK